jgi:multidrug efflux system outer membrane protein
MQTVWSISSRGIAISALALSLAACQSMRGPEPVVNTAIPESFASYSNASGTSIAEQGYKDFFADPRLLQVIDMSLANNRDLRTAVLNIQKL